MKKYRISNSFVIYSKNKKKLEKIKTNILKNQIKYYKFLHPKWTHFLRDKEIKLFIPYLNKNQRILEIGSGDGYIANKLKEQGFNVIASDLEPRFPQWTEVLKVDGKSTNFQSKQYDVIISMHVLEHIENIDEALREFKRLLKDDGIMYHLVPSVSTIFFTSLMQPFAYIRAIYLYFNGYFLSKYQPFKNRNILRFFKSFITTLNPVNFLWGGGHGIHNRLECFYYWRIKKWKEIFERNGFKIINMKQNDLSYSMYKIFPFKFLKIRKYLAKRGLASANLFIIKNK